MLALDDLSGNNRHVMSDKKEAASSNAVANAVQFFELLRSTLKPGETLSPPIETSLRAGVMQVMYDLGRADKPYRGRIAGKYTSVYSVDGKMQMTIATADTGSGFWSFPISAAQRAIWTFESIEPDVSTATLICDTMGSLLVDRYVLDHPEADPRPMPASTQLECIDMFVGDYFTDPSRIQQVG